MLSAPTAQRNPAPVVVLEAPTGRGAFGRRAPRGLGDGEAPMLPFIADNDDTDSKTAVCRLGIRKNTYQEDELLSVRLFPLFTPGSSYTASRRKALGSRAMIANANATSSPPKPRLNPQVMYLGARDGNHDTGSMQEISFPSPDDEDMDIDFPPAFSDITSLDQRIPMRKSQKRLF